MENNSLSLLYDLAINPGKGLTRAREHRPWFFLLGVVILSEISVVTGATLVLSRFAAIEGALFFSGLFLIMVLLTMVWLTNVGILHFFAEVWGKRGRIVDLFITLGLAMFPFIFVSPLSVIVESLRGGRIFFQSIIILALVLWSFFLALAAVREVYSCSTFEALLILLTPILLLLIISVLLPLSCIFLTLFSLSS